MPDSPNFLLGNGHELADQVPYVGGPQQKQHPYTFAEAKDRLVPRVQEAVRVLDDLPQAACPNDWTVAGMTIHPAYIAKSYYPQTLLGQAGFRAVGSKARMILPEKSTRSIPTGECETVELFVAAPRRHFRLFAEQLPQAAAGTGWTEDLRKIEDFRCFGPGERLKPIPAGEGSLLMEIVLHVPAALGFILAGFREYMTSLGIEVDLSRRAHVKGLCFVPVHVPRSLLPQAERFSFLRVARGMPRLRSFRPILRRLPARSARVSLPADGPLDPRLRIAVFDGGLPALPDLSTWVHLRDCDGVGPPIGECVEHGLAVTSALLFGSLGGSEAITRPYGMVDHYRVIGEHTDPASDLYEILDRILEILRQTPYDLVNLSIGPDRPMDDDEIDRWTAELDQLLSDGRAILTVAAGNGGERDHEAELDRIQVPADAVNALSVGACTSEGAEWDRGAYSSIGPGRSPGIVKPDVVAFGGSHGEPFWVLEPERDGFAAPTVGTSFSSPGALRVAAAVRAHYGNTLTPLTIKALLIHRAAPKDGKRLEVGWGRIPNSIDEIVICQEGSVTVAFQGQLVPGRYLRVPIPVPADAIQGMVEIAATFCFASDTDPEHLPNYTRSGLDVTFRPNDRKFARADSTYPQSDSFFRPRDMYVTEIERRRRGQLWETVLHNSRRKRGSSLRNPVFDIHYNARQRGAPDQSARNIPYSLVVTVTADGMPDIYNRVLTRYRTRLEALRPVIEIPIRVGAR